MKLIALALTTTLMSAPAWAQTVAPPSDMIKAVTEKGAIFDVMGMEVDM